jgi:hypothetical protein
MSIGSGIGASSAASEILTIVEIYLEEAKNSTDTYLLDILNEIKQKCLEIKSAGDAGWY